MLIGAGRGFALCLALAKIARGQQIYDMWQTTWSRTPLFQYNPPSMGSLPINFVAPTTIGDADITVDDTTVYQNMYGFGGSLTDSAALTLSNMKSANSDNYWSLLWYMFDVTDGADSAGLSYVRVPLGASDFSANLYSFDDSSGDTALSNFSVTRAPSYVFSVLKDILSINPALKVHLLPWSPPGWMKDSGTMDGGSLQTNYETVYANYLLKCLQGFQLQGIPIFAIGIQNEPENSNPTYPTCSMPYTTEAAIGLTLRTLMDNNGFSSVKIIGYEHNWEDAANYPVSLMNTAASAFDGVSFHCYGTTAPQDQAQFTSKYPDKEVFFTECTGTYGSDWWQDIKWYMSNLFAGGSVSYGASTGLMFNLATDGNGNPKLPGTSSCGGAGCRPVATVNSDGSFSLNQEFYSMAQAAKAIIPRDAGGPYAQRIQVSVGGTLDWTLVVAAYVTTRLSTSDWNRYSLVVMNWYDNSDTSWNPIPVRTTIEFRDMQATITFPVGLTTLWWYAPKSSFNATGSFPETVTDADQPGTVYGQMADGSQAPLGTFGNH